MTADPSRRGAGVLVHPTSLPGPFGMGDAGPPARDLLDWIVEAGLSVWQMLPLTPTGQGHSPYAGPSAFAGNPGKVGAALSSSGAKDCPSRKTNRFSSGAAAGQADR